MRWHRLSLLMDRLASQQARFGYYMSSTEGVILGWQGGVFRTNCMDCLDRSVKLLTFGNIHVVLFCVELMLFRVCWLGVAYRLSYR